MNREKHLRVACAIIQVRGKVLCTQRSASMSLPLKWEFPGGKIDSGESPEDCLRRELQEELGIEVAVGSAYPPATHSYDSFTVTLYPFSCEIISGEITLLEHRAMAWLPAEKLQTLDWAEADLPVIRKYQDEFRRHKKNL